MADLSSINLNRLVVFVAVIEAGSLTAAARRLGLAKTMVSTHMQRLEAEVGASLITRTTRRLSLTDAGAAFYESCRRLLREAEEAVALAGEETADPRGTLKLTATVDYCANVLAPVAAKLMARYPALRIEMLAEDRVVDMVREGLDLAIRIGRLADSSHQAARIGEFENWLVASPRLFEAHAQPRQPEDLAALPFISLAVVAQPLSRVFENSKGEKRAVRFEAAVSTNSAITVRQCALLGMGFAVMPDFAVRGDIAAGRLGRLLPKWQLGGGGIHAVFPATRHRPKKTRVFVEALREYVESGAGVGWN